MKRTCFFLLMLGSALPALSQTKMFINKNNGTTDSLLLSDIKSISFKSGSSTDIISIAGGTFTAGATIVTINNFSIDKYEVTYELWTDVRNWGLTHGYTDLSTGKNGKSPVGTNNPVTNVSWYDVVKWCNARSEKAGLTPVYYTSNWQTTVYRTGQIDINNDALNWSASGYRLPTECEWEFAARGGSKTHGYTFSGSNTVGDVAWYASNSGGSTHTVGQKAANELGIYDMTGNVWEWVWDWWSGAGNYPVGGPTDPKGPATTQQARMARGGALDSSDLFYLNVGCRNANYALTVGIDWLGFRCVQH